MAKEKVSAYINWNLLGIYLRSHISEKKYNEPSMLK